MTSQIHSAVDFYDRHPISAQIILARLEAARGTLEGLQPASANTAKASDAPVKSL